MREYYAQIAVVIEAENFIEAHKLCDALAKSLSKQDVVLEAWADNYLELVD